jgi:hypothetical protein
MPTHELDLLDQDVDVMALNEGGMIFEKDGCSSLAEAMAALEKGLGKWFQESN